MKEPRVLKTEVWSKQREISIEQVNKWLILKPTLFFSSSGDKIELSRDMHEYLQGQGHRGICKLIKIYNVKMSILPYC